MEPSLQKVRPRGRLLGVPPQVDKIKEVGQMPPTQETGRVLGGLEVGVQPPTVHGYDAEVWEQNLGQRDIALCQEVRRRHGVGKAHRKLCLQRIGEMLDQKVL